MTRAPRVLFVTHNVPRFEGDAAGSFVLRLAVALQAAGARVHVIAPGAPGLEAHGTIEQISIERVPYASEQRMTLAYTGTMAEAVTGSWSGKLALLQLLWAMRSRVRRCLSDARRAGDPFDVLHVHWWFPSGLALWKARRAGDPPMVITMHGSDVRLAATKPVVHPVMRAVLGSASACTAVSSWLADTVHRIAPDVRLQVAPMPVDMRHFAEPPQTDARKGLLFVGRLNTQKGLADLLDALARPELGDATLDVVGEGPDRDAFHARAVTNGVAERVAWHGNLSPATLSHKYAAARAVVMPSRGEGLGLVAVEAQLCETPVVAYADGGLLDVVRTAHGGTLVAPGNVSALAEAISRVLRDPAAARRMGRDARDDMLQRFTPHAVAREYMGIYERVLHTGRADGSAPSLHAGTRPS